jgi:hypothetical protein
VATFLLSDSEFSLALVSCLIGHGGGRESEVIRVLV